MDECKVVVVICGDKERKEELRSLMSGQKDVDGECILDNIDVAEDRVRYKKNVDFINLEQVKSELIVKDYLIFYAMVSKTYNEDTLAELNNLFYEIRREDIMDKKVNEISKQDLAIVRCTVAYLKKVKLLLSKNLLQRKTEEEKQELLGFLEKYFVKKSCYCVLFEDHKDCVDNMSVDVIQV